jgi:hypothetical protein
MAPPETDRAFLTPPMVARLLGVAAEKVVGWIRSGELAAFDASTRQGGRPRYLISRDALADFQARRAVRPKPTRRRRKVQAGTEVDFFPPAG